MRRRLSRDLITEAGLEIVAEGGVTALTMRALGRHLQVEAMSLYNHFTGKNAVTLAMIAHLYGTDVADELTPDDDCDDPETDLLQAATAFLIACGTHPNNTRLDRVKRLVSSQLEAVTL